MLLLRWNSGVSIGLRWEDVDFENNQISINHTLVYYNHGGCGGCYFGINTPKTKAGERTIPIIESVKEALEQEKEYQRLAGIKCTARVTGHFVVHICQSLYIRKYIPSLITSIICLPISIVVLIKCFGYLEFDLVTVICIIAGIAFMILNLRFAHMLMHRFNAKRD